MKTTAIALIMVIFFINASTHELLAGERIALVIGNSKYEHLPTLDNPKFDTELIGKALDQSAFTVITAYDVRQDNFEKGLNKLASNLKQYTKDNDGVVIEAVLFYYAGHAVQINGENYLLPVDISDDEHDVLTRGVRLNSILARLGDIGAGSQIVILDSCRDNPFSGSSEGSSGLAEIEAKENTYIAFATKPGGVASDGVGLGDNSPFSSNLAHEMATHNITIEEMFKRVRKAVIRETNGEQLPWDASSLTGEFSFRPTGDFGQLEIKETPSMKDQMIWDRSVKDSNDADAYRAYLMMFPNGLHAKEAKEFLDEN